MSISVLGDDKQNWITAILGLVIFEGPPALILGLLLGNIKPSINEISSAKPPNFLTILISLKSTLVLVVKSHIFLTACIASGATSLEF